MDLTPLMAMASPVVAAALAYLRDEAAKKAGDKAAEVVGEKVATAAAGAGPRALATLRAWLGREGDAKAREALARAEAAPAQPAAGQALVEEVARLAAGTPAFAQELRLLAGQATVVQGDVQQHISNEASNQGAQGVFNGPVTFGARPPAPGDEGQG